MVVAMQHTSKHMDFHFRPITDFNEVTLHFIQCVRMHIENTKSKVSRRPVLKSLKYSHDIILVATPYKDPGLHCRLVVPHELVLQWECQAQMDSLNRVHRHL